MPWMEIGRSSKTSALIKRPTIGFFLLDADERITPDLAQRLQQLAHGPDKAYLVQRPIVPGRVISTNSIRILNCQQKSTLNKERVFRL